MRIGTLLLTVGLLAAPQPLCAQTYLVIVSGLAGDAGYADELHEWASGLVDAAQRQLGLPEAHVIYLADAPERDPTRITGRSTKENVEQVVRELAQRAEPDAQVVMVLLGHGSYRNGESRFNLPGPDLTAKDFAELLTRFASQRIAFVNTTSASGEFIPLLSGDRRIIVTATKSGFERNRTMFGKFFAEALVEGGADVDKDERVSLLEAFDYARGSVIRAYEQEKRLLTEHAQLDDNGDGRGTTEPGPSASDGALAQIAFLSGAVPTAATGDPRLAALYVEKEDIERRLATLRTEKDQMEPTVYEQRLEELLVALAQTSRRIRELEQGGSR
jgi:hypothetical protein